jgi:hypothetical protein
MNFCVLLKISFNDKNDFVLSWNQLKFELKLHDNKMFGRIFMEVGIQIFKNQILPQTATLLRM